jgi:hypothetical protein
MESSVFPLVLFMLLGFSSVGGDSAVDSKTSLVVGSPRKAGGKLAMAWSKVLPWWVGTEKRILCSKAVGVSILGDVEGVIALQCGDGDLDVIPRKRGISFVATPPKISHTSCPCVG